jgi:hypothetical protein
MSQKRIRVKIGDVFAADIGEGQRKLFQYVGRELTQLNSDVIRVFETIYSTGETPDLETAVKDQIQFYAHCFINFGVKLGYWERIGNMQEVGDLNILFRHSGDHGDKIPISEDWWVWKPNDERMTRVGILKGGNRKAEIGIVFTRGDIVHRMRTGQYPISYPDFE